MVGIRYPQLRTSGRKKLSKGKDRVRGSGKTFREATSMARRLIERTCRNRLAIYPPVDRVGNRMKFATISMHSSYSAAHHRTGVWLPVLLLRPDSITGLLPPLAVIAIQLVIQRLGILPLFPIFYSNRCPHQASFHSFHRFSHVSLPE
ncbi:hypothetical protein Golax_003858, partial [Gossypium laxum]|nr:hypothetical protein [Gossypium laxum]